MAENHQEASMGFFDKLKKITTNLFSTYTEADEAFFEELEETLILSDFGMEIAVETVEKLREKVRKEKLVSQEEVRAALREIIVETLNVGTTEVNVSTSPCVFLFIGVNGVGKTTSIGKMANLLRYGGKKCLLCAGDTFRAAAADQLEIWSQRAQAELVRQHEGADPGAVLFDALQAAKARGVDVVLCDTAGRLHNKANLMAELSKLSKIIDRECPGAARETLLVLDATTGQNGLVQAKTFKETAGLTGIILTKLDGTAKGGIAVAIAKELGVPVKFAGVGEGIDDLRPFDSEEYAQAII
jgi:fused signal recognition particle receptor